MNYSFNIRKAVPEDAKDIQNILIESFKKYKNIINIPDYLEPLEESLKDIKHDIENNYVFIAIIDDKSVGTVRLNFKDDKTAYLSRFAVKLNYHNIGIGKSMLNLVNKLAESMDIKKIFLYTASKHYDLVKFYYNRGFYIDSTTKDRGYIRALMIKEL
jgi:N-acetylglutamate synthase-like GNAT family acetyltransferase